jgi:hypothetical protein
VISPQHPQPVGEQPLELSDRARGIPHLPPPRRKGLYV